MDTSKNYSLYSDNIEKAIKEFIINDNTLSLEVSKTSPTQYVYKVIKDGETGVITFYIKKSGLVSINIQGKTNLKQICEDCCDYVILQTAIPNSQKKSFSIKDCNLENYDYFKEDLLQSDGYTFTVKGVENKAIITEILTITDVDKGRVTTTLFANGTFMVQGNVTPLFVKVMTEAISWLMKTENAANVPDVINLENITNKFNTDINVLIPNLAVCNDTDNIILRMVMTSITLFNSGIIVDDYGCYTFGVLKALEGVLKLRLEIDLGMIDKLGDHFDWDPATHSHRIKSNVYDGNLHLKVAINKTYNYWKSKRHASFHADAQLATSDLYTYERAVEVGVKALECINEICDNW